jgi:starch-binding outer membrane protein, SusD/RagB family
MKKIAKLTAVLAFSASAAGCSDFLTGPGLTQNPNDPTTVALQQQFVAAQANIFGLMESQFARLAAMYVQHIAGTNNQQRDWGSRYQITEGDINNQWGNIYAGGGLIDLRRIQEGANAAGDAQWEGIAKIYEAFLMGMMASIFGDLPYSEAVGESQTPNLDPQEQIYAAVQSLLDNAITLLGGTGPGPGATDLVFGGNTTRWRKVANTLKARFHLHTAERLGAAAYNAAITAANAGIDEAPTTVDMAVHQQAPGNLRAFHGNTVDDGNLWGQFNLARDDFRAGRALVETLKARTGDPRLAGYFDANTAGQFAGATQFGLPFTTAAADVPSPLDVTTRRAFTFRQPLVTWTENQFILAEAKFQTAGAAAALPHVNNVRVALGLAPLGAVTLADIMTEKWIAMFQNIEAWNDYKRTCLPVLVPGGDPVATEIPGRIPYAVNERQNNPNFPLPSNQPARNWNDPNAC